MLIEDDDATTDRYRAALVLDSLATVRCAKTVEGESQTFELVSQSPQQPELRDFQAMTTAPTENGHWMWNRPSASLSGEEKTRRQLFDYLGDAHVAGFEKVVLKTRETWFRETGNIDSTIEVEDKNGQILVRHVDLSDPLIGRSDPSVLRQFMSEIETKVSDLALVQELLPQAVAVPDLFRNKAFSLDGIGVFTPSYDERGGWPDTNSPMRYNSHYSDKFTLPIGGRERAFKIESPYQDDLELAPQTIENFRSSSAFERGVKQAIWSNFLEFYPAGEGDEQVEYFLDELQVAATRAGTPIPASLPEGPDDVLPFIIAFETPSFSVFRDTTTLSMPMEFAWSQYQTYALVFDEHGQLRHLEYW